MADDPEFRELEIRDAAALADLLQGARPDYVAHFHPFPFDTASLEMELRRKNLDRWWQIRCQGDLAGFVMLRGFDEGYRRPAFGVFIRESFAGRGLASRALDHALIWCRAHTVPTVLLKVDPANSRAVGIYERAGFCLIGVCPKTGQQMMEKKL